MTLGELAIILAAIGLVLVVSELFLPTHGILAISGIASLFGVNILDSQHNKPCVEIIWHLSARARHWMNSRKVSGLAQIAT